MARPLGRVLTLLELLQSGGTRTVGQLAERLGVDERTVRRYASQLGELGIPVQAVRGRYGGYRLAPGYRLPPLMLTDDEALATLVALATASAAGVARETAAAKIRRVLPSALAGRLDTLLHTAHLPAVDAEPTAADLLLFARAARERRPVFVRYVARNGRDSERTVQPYGLVAHAGHWYVTGADSRTAEVRTFRLDRVRHAVVREGSFDVPAGFDPAGQVHAAVSTPSGAQRVVVRVRATPGEIARRVPPHVATVTCVDDDWVRMTLYAHRLDWVPSLLAAFDRPFAIEEPDELRAELRIFARRLERDAARA